MGVTRKVTLGFVAGVMAVALLVGGGTAWAYWTVTAQVFASITTPRVEVTQFEFDVLKAAYSNATLKATGSFTVTNTGAVAGTATIAISAIDIDPNTDKPLSPVAHHAPVASADVAPQMPLHIWPGTSDAACKAEVAVPASAASGTWADTSISGVALAARQAQLFCVRTDVPVAQRNALAFPNTTGAETYLFDGKVNVSLAAAGWTATATGTALQRSRGIYQLDPALAPVTGSRWYAFHPAGNANTCMDVDGSGPAGASVISFTCRRTNNVLASNQAWQVIPVNEADRSLVSLQPRHATNTRLTVTEKIDENGKIVDRGSPGRKLTIMAGPLGLPQQWYVQRVSTTAVQFVSAADGLCLSMPTASGQLLTALCQNRGTVFVAPESIPPAGAG